MNRRVWFPFVVPWLIAAMVAACEPAGDLESRSPAPTSSTVPAESAGPSSESAAPSAGASVVPATPTPTSSTTVRVYFYLGGEPGSDGLVPVERSVAADDPVSGAMDAVLAGPTSAEGGDRTITSAIPDGSRLLGLTVDGGVASIDLSREYESGGGSLSMFVRLGQVVYTLTQFPEITAVAFRIEGQRVTVFSGEGIALDRPQTRADSAGVLPAIFVDQPAYGGAIANPGRISGTADVFEAQFRVTLLDAAGTTIADMPVMAACGSGCRGAFDVTVPYRVDRPQTGTLRAWDGSMKDGRPINVREYLVGLVPAG
ncbi:MAG: GerMN domain-containing protein [Candidatus Limnocylindrales bacterium]